MLHSSSCSPYYTHRCDQVDGLVDLIDVRHVQQHGQQQVAVSGPLGTQVVRVRLTQPPCP